MLILYHLPFDPASRQARLVLAEKQIAAEYRIEQVHERRPEFLALNPAGEAPVLQIADTVGICSARAIVEYLEETHPGPRLIPGGPLERAEIRRLVSWFDEKFHREVSGYLIGEKITKRQRAEGEPNSEAIRAAHANMDTHLCYIGYLAEQRSWLAGEHFSLADIVAAAHISCIDYLNDVPWEDYGEAKQWYARIKSRPSFRPLLEEHIPGMPPSAHYADLDF